MQILILCLTSFHILNQDDESFLYLQLKEHKLNRGLINHMDEIYDGSDDLGCVDSDIRLLNSVLIDNGLVFVIAAKKREFRKNEGRNNDDQDSSTKK